MTIAQLEKLQGDTWTNNTPKGSVQGRIIKARTVPTDLELETDRGTVAAKTGDVIIRSSDGQHIAIVPGAIAAELLQPVEMPK